MKKIIKGILYFLIFILATFNACLFGVNWGMTESLKEQMKELEDTRKSMHIERVYINNVPYEIALEFRGEE